MCMSIQPSVRRLLVPVRRFTLRTHTHTHTQTHTHTHTATLYVYFVDQYHSYILLISTKSFWFFYDHFYNYYLILYMVHSEVGGAGVRNMYSDTFWMYRYPILGEFTPSMLRWIGLGFCAVILCCMSELVIEHVRAEETPATPVSVLHWQRTPHMATLTFSLWCWPLRLISFAEISSTVQCQVSGPQWRCMWW